MGELRCGGSTEFKPEDAAHADPAFDADHSAHEFHQELAHHQANARTFLGATLLAKAIERLKELAEGFWGQAHARIPDAEANALWSG